MRPRQKQIDRRTFLTVPLGLAASPFLPRIATAAAGPKPNVVLIVADGWRAQAVPWENDPNLKIPTFTTPNLAKLAREGATFSRAYSCYPRLIEGRDALFYGKFPHAISDDHEGGANLGTLLRQAGYRGAIFANRPVDEIVAFVHEKNTGPFLVEWTFDSGMGLMDRSGADRIQWRDNVPAASQDRARDELGVYYARCTARDHEIGVLLEALDGPDLSGNTMVVFTSDRGAMLGSQGLWGDGVAFEESVRIPLAIRYPNALAPGTANSMLISQADLMPTILALCGVATPASVQGRDLSALMTGPAPGQAGGDRPDSVYAEGRIGETDEWRMVVRGYDKLVATVEGETVHLYNLADDPYEMTDLAREPSSQLTRDGLRALLQAWMRKLGDRVDPTGLKKR